ncbi:hydrolase TatD [Gammaproteobacteria bacterium 42_54_T18]|nr:hydrolase TatD [Gammaproteobacteria bacterium 42_54_T18]
MFIDSHCHLDKLDAASEVGGIKAALQRANDQQVSHVLCIGIDMENIQNVIHIAETHSNVFATVGAHPLYQENKSPRLDELLLLAEHPKVVGIGESGLDYFYCKGDLQWQRDRFVTHIQAAVKSNLPLIVHTRAAKLDTLNLLVEHGQGKVKGVLHCFTEDLDMAHQAIELGFYISISGIVTFNSADELRSVVDKVPLEKLLIETDAPWLTPVPNRGKPNEPKYVVDVAKKIAEIKGISIETVAQVTTNNFFTLFSKAKNSK